MTWRTCRASGMCFSLFVISRVSYFQSEDVPRCPKMPLPRCPKIELNDWLEVSNCDVPSLGWDWLDQLINMCQEIESANSWKRRSEVVNFAFWDTKVKHAAAAVMSCHVSGALWGRVCLKMVACPQYSNFHGANWHMTPDKTIRFGGTLFSDKALQHYTCGLYEWCCWGCALNDNLLVPVPGSCMRLPKRPSSRVIRLSALAAWDDGSRFGKHS